MSPCLYSFLWGTAAVTAHRKGCHGPTQWRWRGRDSVLMALPFVCANMVAERQAVMITARNDRRLLHRLLVAHVLAVDWHLAQEVECCQTRTPGSPWLLPHSEALASSALALAKGKAMLWTVANIIRKRENNVFIFKSFSIQTPAESCHNTFGKGPHALCDVSWGRMPSLHFLATNRRKQSKKETNDDGFFFVVFSS